MAAEKEPMGKVKLRVRECALTMKEFTLEEMVRATGLNKDSVESELKRMRKRELITVNTVRRPQRGRPHRIFRLTSDSEKRFKMSSQVAEFYPKPPTQARPTSHHYFNAVGLLDSLEDSENAEERERVLAECEEELRFAWYEEGSPDGVLDAFIRSQKGRVEYWRGNYEQAQALLGKAMETFDAYDLPEEKAWVEEHLLASRVQQKWAAEPDPSLLDKIRSMIVELGDLGRSLSAKHPMLALLLSVAEQLSPALQSARAVVLEHANSTVSSAVENTLLKTVVMASHTGAVWEGDEALATVHSRASSRRQYAYEPAVSPAWRHSMQDPYIYEQPVEQHGEWVVKGMNSPPRKNMGAATAAAAGPNLPEGTWRKSVAASANANSGSYLPGEWLR